MSTNQPELKWAEFKEGLVSASSEHSCQSWLDEGEIRVVLRDACARGITPEVIIACQSACRSQQAFVDHLAGVVGKRKKRILAVDDEKEFLELLEVNFNRTNRYELRTVSDPLVAVDAVQEFQPDLCIVDLKMPGMDGSELIDHIRATSQISNIPVIILTALLTDTAVEAVTKNNVLHLSKPASWKKLLYCIEEHLKQMPSQPASDLATIDV